MKKLIALVLLLLPGLCLAATYQNYWTTNQTPYKVIAAAELGVQPSIVTNWTDGGFVARTIPDVTAALQTALNACGTNGSMRNRLLLTNGIYRITGSLSVPPGVQIEGCGYAHNTAFGAFMLTNGASMIWEDNTNSYIIALICTNNGVGRSELYNLEVCGFTNPLMTLPKNNTNVPGFVGKWSYGTGVFASSAGTNPATANFSGGHTEENVVVCGFGNGVDVEQNYSRFLKCQQIACYVGIANYGPINGDQLYTLQNSVGGFYGEVGYVLNANGVVIEDPCDIYYQQFIKATNGTISILGGNSEGLVDVLTPPFTTNLIELHGSTPQITLVGSRFAVNNLAIVSYIDFPYHLSITMHNLFIQGYTGFNGTGSPLLFEVNNGCPVEASVIGWYGANGGWARECQPANGTTHRVWKVGDGRVNANPFQWLGNTSLGTNQDDAYRLGIQLDPTKNGNGGSDYLWCFMSRFGFYQPARVLACDPDVPSTTTPGAIMNTNITVNDELVRGTLSFPATDSIPTSIVVIGYKQVTIGGVAYKIPLTR